MGAERRRLYAALVRRRRYTRCLRVGRMILQGMRQAEIARALGCSPSTVSQDYAILMRMARELDQEGA
jgi:DNA-binding NarL/FixJ family response regulator